VELEVVLTLELLQFFQVHHTSPVCGFLEDL